MDLFDLAAKIVLDKSDYESGLKEASGETEQFAEGLGGKLAAAGKMAAKGLAVAGAAVVAVTGATVKGVADTAAYADNIDKASQKMGISAKAYQEWAFVMEHSGTSIDSATASMKNLVSKAESGSDAFGKLGLKLEDVQSMSQEDLFGAVITGLQNMESGMDKTALATELLGRGAMEMGALLNTSAEDTQAMFEQVNALGGVMSDDAVKAGAAFQDSLQNLKTALGGAKNGIMGDMMPSLTLVMDGLTAMFGDDPDSGVAMVAQGLENFMAKLADNVPKLIDMGIKLLTNMIKGIIKALPDLVAKAPEIVKSLVNGIIELLPLLLETGVQLLTMLGNGINSLMGWIQNIGSQIVDKIKAGIANAWSSLVSWFKGLFSSLFGNLNVNVGVHGANRVSASGIDYVPTNGTIAYLHKGEAVLTAAEADAWRNGNGGSKVTFNIYPQTMDENQMNMVIQKANRYLGGALA